jgi:hypothetical protein
VLYTDYAYPFEIASVILLVAIIAAVMLTLRKRKENKAMHPSDQIAVKAKDRMRLVKMAPEVELPAGQGGGTGMISLSHYLILAAILFAISVVGIFLNRKNLIVLLMAIELMLLAVNINFVAFSHYLNDLSPASSSFSSSSSWQPPSRASAWPSWWCCSATCLDRCRRPRQPEGLSGYPGMKTLYLLVPLAPLAGAILAGFFGKILGRAGAHSVTILGVAISFVLSVHDLPGRAGRHTFNGAVYTWMESGGLKLEVGFLIDR